MIFSGELSVYASDDGINAASDKLQGAVVIRGGNVYINAAGDAIDSNRSIIIEGGTTVVEGPVNGRNSIFDTGDGADAVLSISGGTVLATGSAEKAKNFKEGTQYSRLELISGKAGDEITADDGTGTVLTASKDFSCVIYSSPAFREESQILIRSKQGQGQQEDAEWDLSVQTEITEEIRACVNEAAEGLLGAAYEPVSLLGRKGDTVCILCRAAAVYPGAKPYYALMYISTAGEKASVLAVREVWLDAEA